MQQEGKMGLASPLLALAACRTFCRRRDTKHTCPHLLLFPSVCFGARSQLYTSAWNCFVLGFLRCSFSVSKRAVNYEVSEGQGVSDILPLDMCNNANQFACFVTLNLMPQGVSQLSPGLQREYFPSDLSAMQMLLGTSWRYSLPSWASITDNSHWRHLYILVQTLFYVILIQFH